MLHGRVGLWPLCSLLFVYNAALYFGFLNFLFGLGVALLGFSGWVASERWHTITRVTVFSVVASLVFILHLFALGIYGLLVGSYEFGNMLADRRWSPEEHYHTSGKIRTIWSRHPPVVGEPVDSRAYVYFLRECRREDRCAGRTDGIGRNQTERDNLCPVNGPFLHQLAHGRA